MKQQDIYDYTLMLGDSSLIMAQRLSEWTGHGPMLEQDIAITNITLDHIGQSRLLYQFAAGLKNNHIPDSHTTEDTLAYLRDAHEYRNVLIAELPNGDWAQSVLKIFLFAQWQKRVYGKLVYSPVKDLSAIAEKSLKEVAYHIRWSADWVKRLGDGTKESHSRMQKALKYLWPYTGEFFIAEKFEEVDVFENPGKQFFESLRADWLKEVSDVIAGATLSLPATDTFMHTGGKRGLHTEYLGYILAEMQFLQRAYPGCEW